MPQIIAPERQARPAAPGLSYWLGQKLTSGPVAMEAGFAARLADAIRDKAFDAPLGAPMASKFAGSPAGMSGYRVTEDGVAIVPVQGMLLDRGAWLGDLGGYATTYEGLAEQCRRIAKDDAVKAVLLDIDSGGGMALGLFDFCGELVELRRKKRVVALAANFAASAAYAIACTADELFVTQTAGAGSIGTIMVHTSYQRALDQYGMDTTIVFEGDHKPDGNPYQQLSPGARAEMAALVQQCNAQFVAHVVKERGLSEEAVRGLKARLLWGSNAVAAGLADGVKSFESVVSHLKDALAKGGRPRGPKKSASNPKTSTTGEPGMPGNTSGDRPDITAVIEAYRQGLEQSRQSAAPAAPAPAPAPAAAPAATAAPAAAPALDARARVKAILGCEAAKERPKLAQHLALETDIAPDAAEAVLAAAQVEAKPEAVNPLQAAMRQPGTSAGIAPEASSATGGAAKRPSIAEKVAARAARMKPQPANA